MESNEDNEPRLDAPAAVGNARFHTGVKWSTVIAAAQRHYQYVTGPEQERERMKRAGEFIRKVHGASED